MKTPHYLLTNTITSVNIDSLSIINDLDTVQQLKKLPGKSIHVIGGAKTVCSVLNAGLIDEIRLTIHPVILGGGKSLFQNVELRKYLNFVESQNLSAGK